MAKLFFHIKTRLLYEARGRQCQKPDCGILGQELYFSCSLGCGTVKVAVGLILCSMRTVSVDVCVLGGDHLPLIEFELQHIVHAHLFSIAGWHLKRYSDNAML